MWELTVVCATPHLSLWRQKYNVTQQSYFILLAIKLRPRSSCSSSYSRYLCVLVVFSGQALTVVLQKFIMITNKTLYDLILLWNLCRDLKANFSMGFIPFLCNTSFRFIPQRSRICCCLCKDCHTIIRMQFSSRTLKIVRTFLDRGSVTKKIYIFTILVYIKKKRKIAKLGNWNLYFTNKLNANVQNKNLAIAIMKSSLQK